MKAYFNNVATPNQKSYGVVYGARMISLSDKKEAEMQKKSVKDFMAVHGLNVLSWSKKAGIAESALRRFLNKPGQLSLKTVTIKKLAESVGFSPDYILNFGRDSKMIPKPETMVNVDRLATITSKILREAEKLKEATGEVLTPHQMAASIAGQYQMAIIEDINKSSNKKSDNHFQGKR